MLITFLFFVAMGELYSRLPQYYRQTSVDQGHTTLHKRFSQTSLDIQSEQSYTPLTVHQGAGGTTFSSILTRSNTEQLEAQGTNNVLHVPMCDFVQMERRLLFILVFILTYSWDKFLANLSTSTDIFLWSITNGLLA